MSDLTLCSLWLKKDSRFLKCVIVLTLVSACLMCADCGGPKSKYQIGEIYRPAANHSAWTKLNQRPKQSSAHNKYVTIYANEQGNQVKQHGGQYQQGAA